MKKMRIVRNSLLTLLLCAPPITSFGQVGVGIGIGVSVHVPPPPLPVYVQPPCPTPGYLWTPGYWAYGPAGFYWVQGVWVAPPHPGLLWTPGYWRFAGGVYAWHVGYWGPHVGFYGGVNYGFGYGGVGFGGGYWRGGEFAYNRSVTNINTTIIHNTYNQTVINNANSNRTSFNGGPGGINARPTAQEQMAAREQHMQATANQMEHQRAASADRAQLASANHGRPGVTAMDTVNGRQYNQQGRIAQGIRSGQMTPAEAARTENRQGNINRQIHNDRRANGGYLTARQRRNINQRQNRASRQIYNEKHNKARAQR